MTHQEHRLACPCGKPTNGVTLCSDCRRTTHYAVANVAVFHDDLETVRTGQTRYGLPAKGAIGKSMPLGMDSRFGPTSDPASKGSRAQQATRLAVVSWARKLMLHTPQDQPAHDSVRSVCAYLDRNLGALVTLDWAPDFKGDMLSLENTLKAIVDRPAEGWYAGECGAVIGVHDATTCGCACHHGQEIPNHDVPCDVPEGCGELGEVTCTRVLYAEPEKDYVRCRACGTEWPVRERRELLIREAEDRQATVRMLARVITTLGASDASEAKLENRINVWVHRGRLVANGSRVVDGKVRSLYRVGDVLELLARDIERDTEKTEERRATRRAQMSERAS